MLQAKVKTAPQKQYATLDTRKVVCTPEPIMISRCGNVLNLFKRSSLIFNAIY